MKFNPNLQKLIDKYAILTVHPMFQLLDEDFYPLIGGWKSGVAKAHAMLIMDKRSRSYKDYVFDQFIVDQKPTPAGIALEAYLAKEMGAQPIFSNYVVVSQAPDSMFAQSKPTVKEASSDTTSCYSL